METAQATRPISYRAQLALDILWRRADGAWMLSAELADGIEHISHGERLGADHESRRRRIREVVAELRRAGIPVVGDPQQGIRLAISEADGVVQQERSRHMGRIAFALGRRVREAAAVEPVGRQPLLF